MNSTVISLNRNQGMHYPLTIAPTRHKEAPVDSRPVDLVSSLLPLAASVLNPLGKLFALLSNVDEAGPGLQIAKVVAHVVLFHISVVAQETLLPFPLNLACPDTPLNRPKRARSHNQTEHGN